MFREGMRRRRTVERFMKVSETEVRDILERR